MVYEKMAYSNGFNLNLNLNINIKPNYLLNKKGLLPSSPFLLMQLSQRPTIRCSLFIQNLGASDQTKPTASFGFRIGSIPISGH